MRDAPEPTVKHAIVLTKVPLERVQNGSSLLDTLAGLVDGLSAVHALPTAEFVSRRLELLGHHAGQLPG
jgi:hypothetical protein